MADISRKELLTELLDEMGSNRSNQNIAVLWDVENVTPGKDSLFVEGLLEYLQQFGRITVGKVYGNWTLPSLKHLGTDLSSNHFQLIHTPKARKNSSDMIMITDGMEVALKHDYIDLYVLITGDSDFRPFISSLRRNGKKIHIVCDIKIASEDLLILADEFIDYRELLPGGDDEPDDDDRKSTPRKPSNKQEKEKRLDEWINRLVEAVQALRSEGKSPQLGVTKIKMKMLNPEFDEKKLGFNKWSKFVKEAIERDYLILEGEMGGGDLKISSKVKRTELPFIPVLKQTLSELGGRSKWLNFSIVGEELRQKGIIPKEYGFKQFKQLFHAAENRNIVETKAEGFTHSIKLA